MAENDQPYEWAWQLNDESALPEPFNQGPAGSCAIIASSQACAAAYKIQDDVLLRLANQQLINEIQQVYPCDIKTVDKYNVPSAFASVALKFIKEHGIGMAEELPYRACRTDEKLPKNSLRLKIGGYDIYSNTYRARYGDHFHFVRDMGGKVIEELIRERPIVGEFNHDESYKSPKPESWENIYNNREMDHASGSGHCILVTGYGHEERGANPFYWCQESAGPHYGAYGGYRRIARDCFHTFYNVNNPYLVLPKIGV